MMSSPLLPKYGGAQRAAQTTVVSPTLLHLRFDVPAWDVESGRLRSRSGHEFVWSRNEGTPPTLTDANGQTYTALEHFPAYTTRVLASGRRIGGLRTIREETCTAEFVPRVGPTSGMVRFIADAETMHVAGEVYLIALSTEDPGDPFFHVMIDEVAGVYRATYSNGTTEVSSEAPWTVDDIGREVTLRWTQTAAGVLTLWRSYDRGTEVITEYVPGSPEGGGGFLPLFIGLGSFLGSTGEASPGTTVVVPPDASAPISLVPWPSDATWTVNGVFNDDNGLPGVYLGVVVTAGIADYSTLSALWE